jgi:thymidylate synthase
MNRLPVLFSKWEGIARAWEDSVVKCWKQGIDMKTQYDQSDTPLGKACTMIIEVLEPFSEPRIHKRFPGGLNDLEVYKQEVIDGIHDSWIDYNDKCKWQYTYHERLTDYKISGNFGLNQLDIMVANLSKCYYTRRAQAITWEVARDIWSADPPCLQRIWGQVLGDEEQGYKFEMHTHWRSRDALKAAYMNIFALTELQKVLAGKISKASGKEIGVGAYVDITDNFHIPGSYFKDIKDFMDYVDNTVFEERTWNTEFAEPIFQETKEKLKNS